MRKKLTEKLKSKIKAKEISKAELTGEALIYYNRVRSLEKARRIKKSNTVRIGGHTLKKGTTSYTQLESLARDQGLTLKQFLKKNKKSIAQYLSTQLNYSEDYLENVKELVKGMPRKNHFSVDGTKIRRDMLLLTIDLLTQKMFSETDAFRMIVRYGVNPTGTRIDILIPQQEDFEDIEDEEEFESLLGEYGAKLIRSRPKYIERQKIKKDGVSKK